MDGVGVFDGEVRMVFVKSGCIRGDFCPSLDSFDGALIVTIASRVEGFVEHEQRAYENPAFEAQRKMWNSLMVTRGERNKREKCRLERCCCYFFVRRSEKMMETGPDLCCTWSACCFWVKQLRL